MTDMPFDYPGFKPPSPTPPKEQNPFDCLGLAVVSLTLAVIGLVISAFVLFSIFGIFGPVFTLGSIGITGLVLGIAGLRGGPKAKSLAGWGIGLSIASLVLASVAGLYLHHELSSFATESNWDVWIGEPAPDFTVSELDGNEIQLSQYKGKRIVLDFFATWCGPCVMEIPHFIEMRNSISDEELIILGISNESPEELKPFIAEHKINYPIISADELPEPFKMITAYPTTFFIDRNGIIQNVLEGYHDLEDLRENAIADDYVVPTKTETDDTTTPEIPANEQ